MTSLVASMKLDSMLTRTSLLCSPWLTVVLACALVLQLFGCDDERSSESGPVDALTQDLEAELWPSDGLTATNSVQLKDRVQFDGSVAVVQASPGLMLASGAELTVGHDAVLAGDARADTLRLEDRSSVTGDASFNSVSGSGSIQGSSVTPLTLPLAVDIPALPV